MSESVRTVCAGCGHVSPACVRCGDVLGEVDRLRAEVDRLLSVAAEAGRVAHLSVLACEASAREAA